MSFPVIKGSIPALVTPFKNDRFDEDAYRALVEWHIEQGTHGLIPVGTTGESATVTDEEHIRIIRVCVEQAKGRVPVIAGTGANATSEAIELTKAAKEAGADATLQVTPYYNKPTQDGLFAHLEAIWKAAPLPQIVYNVPGRTGFNIAVDTVARLAEKKFCIGIKEATADIKFGADIIAKVPDDFAVLSGDDFTFVALIAMGGKGNISVSANVAPKTMAQINEAALAGDFAKARALQYTLLPLHTQMFVESNPIPVKWALHLMGKIGPEIRLPLLPLSESRRAALAETLKTVGALP